MTGRPVNPLRVPMLILAGITSTTVLAGCGPSEPSLPRELRVSGAQDGTTVTLPVDSVLAIALPARPALGYSWSVAAADGKLLTQLPDHHEGSGEMGGTDVQVLRFVAAGAGDSNVELIYSRPFGDDPPEATFAIRVSSAGSFAGVIPQEPAALTEPATTELLGLPTHYNVCENGGCTPVKNQGQCGSCWAFATVGTVESAILVKDGVTRDLSEQYLVSCNNNSWSCNGGSAAFAYFINRYVTGETAAGAVNEADMPYTAANGTCTAPHEHHEKLVSSSRVATTGTATVDQIKQAIFDHGVVWASMCADSATSAYKGGIYTGASTCAKANHAIVLTGWDDTEGVWYLRNSWGTRWGENSGNMRIQWGANLVGGNATYVTYGGAAGAGGAAGSTGSGGVAGSGGKMGSGGSTITGSGGSGSGGRTGSGGSGSGGITGSGGSGSGGSIVIGSGGSVVTGSGGSVVTGSGGSGSGGSVVAGSGGSTVTGSGGSAVTGSGGSIVIGSGGSTVTGSGGSVVTGSGGSTVTGAGGVPSGGSGGKITGGGEIAGQGCGCRTAGGGLPLSLTSFLMLAVLAGRRRRR